MTLTRKSKIIIVTVAIAISFAAGRWSTPVKIKEVVKTVEVEKKVEDNKKDTAEKKHVKTTVTETDKPDGTKTVTTVTQDDSIEDTKSDDKITDDKKSETEKSKEVTKNSSPVTISVLGGVDFNKSGQYIYGAQISKPMIGPIVVGVWGLSDLTFGASVGIVF